MNDSVAVAAAAAASQAPRAARRRQRTVARPAEVSGVGLHTGQRVTVRVKPAEPGSGVVFVRTDLPGYARIPATVEHRVAVGRRTALRRGEAEVHTIEHLLSAVMGLGLDNVEVEMDGPEVPGLDGSARQFVDLLREAGLHEQEAERRVITIQEAIGVSQNGGASLVALPYDGFRISYTLDYPLDSIPSMHCSMEINEERYIQDVAPARTFVLRREAEALLAAGFGKGANTENTVVIGDDGSFDGDLRFADEPVRHKLLDIMGDLALLGCPLRGHIVAIKSGHDLNATLVTKILEREGELLQRDDLGTAMSVVDLTRVLPHRYPFLLVDRIIEVQGSQRAVGIKNVTVNEPFFQGHFPGQPVMPGVLLIEAAAQVTGAMFLRSRENSNKLAYLLGVDSFKFRKTVVPGDRVVIESEAMRMKERTGQARVRATVDNQVVCEGVLKFMLIDALTAPPADGATAGA